MRVVSSEGDVADGVEFVVDDQAELGDAVPALAALLIGLARRRREQLAAASATGTAGEGQLAEEEEAG